MIKSKSKVNDPSKSKVNYPTLTPQNQRRGAKVGHPRVFGSRSFAASFVGLQRTALGGVRDEAERAFAALQRISRAAGADGKTLLRERRAEVRELPAAGDAAAEEEAGKRWWDFWPPLVPKQDRYI